MATRTRRNDRPLGDWRTHYERLWKPMATTTPAEPTEGMPLAQFTATREALRAAFTAYERVSTTCRSCKSFSMGTCEQFGDVPKEFQEKPGACEAWTYDSIPFDGGHRP